jgi:chromosome segregation ATPase
MDIERTIEFILGQQAKFAAGLEEMRSLVGRLAQQQLDLVEHVDHFQREITAATLAIAEEQRRLTEEQRHMAEEQRRLTEEQRRLTEAQRRLTEAQTRLEEAQRHTEERLNALIAVVDDLVRRRPPQE